MFCPGTDHLPKSFCLQTWKSNPCLSNVTPALGQKTISHLRADRTRSCSALSESDYITPILSNSHFYGSGSVLWGLVELRASSCEHSGCSRNEYHQQRRGRSLLFWPCSSELPLPFESMHTHTQKTTSIGLFLKEATRIHFILWWWPLVPLWTSCSAETYFKFGGSLWRGIETMCRLV